MPKPGTKLGRYEVKSLIGAGGMGEVYLAADPKIGREVAIKVLPSDFAADADRLARFEQEAQAAGALNHPNILAIYDVDTHDGSAYVVSELLEGETLRAHVSGGPMAVRRATDYAMQVARGLAAAHEKGIIHRDLKPENLFVTKDGRVKILDFGLAKLTETDGDAFGTDMPTRRIKTDAGTVMGTAGYMSPEQLRGQPVDARTDIFSFGAVLYEMLSGEKAFVRDSAADTISAVLREDPPDLSETNKSVDPGLERVVRRCLEKHREQRFHSASDLAFALEALTGIRSGDDNATAFMTGPVSEIRRSRDRSAILPWAAAALCLLAAAVFAGLYFTRSQPRAEVVRFNVPAPPKTGIGEAIAVSPDGRFIAFEGTGANGVSTLWVRPIDSIESRELPGTIGAALPFWSPDSRSIGFFSDGELKRIDVAGGPPQKLVQVTADTRGGSWSSDGTIIYAPGVTDPLFKISATGGVAEPLTTLDKGKSQTSHRWPDFLPDGRHFLYFGRGDDKEAEGIFVTSLDGGGAKFLVPTKIRGEFVPSSTGTGPGRLLFIRDRTLMAQEFDTSRLELRGEPVAVAESVLIYPGEAGPTAQGTFSASDNGRLVYRLGGIRVTQPTVVDANGKAIRTLGPPGTYTEPMLSPDGNRIVFSQSSENSQDIWIYDLTRDGVTRFTFDPSPDVSPVFSPDGSRIVWSSARGGNFSPYHKVASGAGSEEVLIETTSNAFTTSWSRDGKIIYELDGGPSTRTDLWIYDADGSQPPYPYLKTPSIESHAQFSPDGRWVAYTSDEAGRPEVFIQSVPVGTGKWQVSTQGGDQAQWSVDGKTLYFMASDRKIMSVSIGSGTTLEPSRPVEKLQTRVPVTSLVDDRNNYLPFPDGNSFLLMNLTEDDNDLPIVAVLNWESLLSK